MRKLFALTRKIVLMTGKILLAHIGWILIARGRTNPLTGSTPCVTGKIIILSYRKNISCDETKWKIIPVTENILHVTHTVLLVIVGKFPITWLDIHMSQEKPPVTGRIPLATEGV